MSVTPSPRRVRSESAWVVQRLRTEFALRLGDVRLGPPLSRPGKVVAIGLSYPSETKGCRPDAATTPLALRLTILPPVCPPTALDAGSRPFTSEGKRAGQRGYGRDLPPDRNCPRIYQATTHRP
jgi:hypothetical protein